MRVLREHGTRLDEHVLAQPKRPIAIKSAWYAEKIAGPQENALKYERGCLTATDGPYRICTVKWCWNGRRASNIRLWGCFIRKFYLL